jgi:tetratricopeptide (TPR) repeat protein
LRLADSAAAAGAAYQEAAALLEVETRADDPRIAEAYFGWADAAHRLGEFDRADSLLQVTLDRYGRLTTGPYPDHATALYELAMIRMFRGGSAEAVPLLRRALGMQRRIYGPVHPSVAQTLGGLVEALSREGLLEEGAEVGAEAVAVSDSAWGPHHVASAQARQALAVILLRRDEGERAVAVLEEADAILAGQPEGSSGQVVANAILLGQAYTSMGEVERARAQYETTLSRSDELLGAEHPYRAHVLLELARLDVGDGRLELAEARADESLQLTHRVLRPDHRFALWATLVLARVRVARGDLAVADSLARAVLDVQSATVGDDNRETALTLVLVADVEGRLGRHAEAERHARTALSTLERISGSEPGAAEARSVLGAALAAQGRRSEAAPLLNRAYRELSDARSARPSQVRDAEERLRRFRGAAQGRPDREDRSVSGDANTLLGGARMRTYVARDTGIRSGRRLPPDSIEHAHAHLRVRLRWLRRRLRAAPEGPREDERAGVSLVRRAGRRATHVRSRAGGLRRGSLEHRRRRNVPVDGGALRLRSRPTTLSAVRGGADPPPRRKGCPEGALGVYLRRATVLADGRRAEERSHQPEGG